MSTILKHIQFAIEQGLDHTNCSSMVKKQLRMIRAKNKHLTSSTHTQWITWQSTHTHTSLYIVMTNCIKLRNQTQVNWHWWSGPLQEFKRTISAPMPTNLSVCMTPSLVVLSHFHSLISNSIPRPHLLLNRWTNRAGKHFSPGLRLDHSKRTLKTFSIYWQIDTKETFSAPNCSANENCSKKKNNQKKKATKRERRVVVGSVETLEAEWDRKGFQMRRSCSHGKNGEWCVSQNQTRLSFNVCLCSFFNQDGKNNKNLISYNTKDSELLPPQFPSVSNPAGAARRGSQRRVSPNMGRLGFSVWLISSVLQLKLKV